MTETEKMSLKYWSLRPRYAIRKPIPQLIGITTAGIIFTLLSVNTDISQLFNAAASLVTWFLVAEVLVQMLDDYIRKKTKHPSWLMRNQTWLKSSEGHDWIIYTEEGKLWNDMLASAENDKGAIWVHR